MSLYEKYEEWVLTRPGEKPMCIQSVYPAKKLTDVDYAD